MVEWDSQQAFPHFIAEQGICGVNSASSLQSSECWLNADISDLEQVDSAACLQLCASDNNFNNRPIAMDHNIEVQDVCLHSTNECAQNANVLNQNASDHFVEDPYAAVVFPNYDYEETSPPLSFWGSPVDFDENKMEEVFQVDKEDLFQGPTLAELNANDESLFDTLNAFDFSSVEIKCDKLLSSTLNSSMFQREADIGNGILQSPCSNFVSSPVKITSLCNKDCSQPTRDVVSSVFDLSTEVTLRNPCINSEKSVTNETCLKADIPETASAKTVVMKSEDCSPSCSKDSSQVIAVLPSTDSKVLVSRKANESCSNPRNNTFSDNFWKMPHVTTAEYDFHDENTYDESSSSSVESDDEQDDIQSPKRSVVKNKNGVEKKKPCYFWQYNTQAKGPKGSKWKNSHCAIEAPSGSTTNFKDLVKSRRSGSNDLTPCPQKLYNIGVELHKLNSVINNLTPVNALPFNARPKCRKEKNKLASRVCRLKKKAQYEANKLKLYGLQQEHDALLLIIDKVKKTVVCKVNSFLSQEFSCTSVIEKICAKQSVSSVADCQAEFVNRILKNVESGDPTGGLDKFFHNPRSTND